MKSRKHDRWHSHRNDWLFMNIELIKWYIFTNKKNSRNTEQNKGSKSPQISPHRNNAKIMWISFPDTTLFLYMDGQTYRKNKTIKKSHTVFLKEYLV